jgi:uncharacterized repeat protein (TIGR04138 family)
MSDEIHPLVKLLCEDHRYKLEAYQFVRAGLAYAQEVMRLGQEPDADAQMHRSGRPLRHVSGQDLCRALREFAHEQFGLLARHVLANWGIRTTSDIGEIVYNLIKIGEMTKSPHDRRADFDDVFDFEQALVKDFEITAKTG